MLRNTEKSWGLLARLLHWLTAAMIIGLFFHGLFIDEFVSREIRGGHLSIHASVGISLLALLLLRVLWRIMNPTPKPLASASHTEIMAAHAVHWGLYVLAFATAIAGWFVAGSGRQTLDYYLFGILPMPNMLGTGSPLHDFLEEAHELAAYALMALIAAHIAAVVWHEAVRKDGIMARMTSGKPDTSL